MPGFPGLDGPALDLAHCQLYCHMCRDYVYDRAVDAIVLEEQRRVYDDLAVAPGTAATSGGGAADAGLAFAHSHPPFVRLTRLSREPVRPAAAGEVDAAGRQDGAPVRVPPAALLRYDGVRLDQDLLQHG